MNVYQKLFNIQNNEAFKGLLREKSNISQEYKYFDEKQVLDQLKPLLAKEKLLLLLSDSKQDFTYQKVGVMYEVKYLKELKIIDIEGKGEHSSLELNFWACGNNQDLAKAKGASDTYAVKYLLSKLFLVPVGDNLDPDLSPPINKVIKNK
jgi:hypothetical protein